MADPVTIAIGAAVAGTGMSAFGSLQEGKERSRASLYEASNYETQAAQLRQQEQEYKIAAAQTEARRRDELTSSLETIQAIRSGRGVGAGSPTAIAILESTTADEGRDIRTERLNYLSKAEQARMASVSADRSARLAKKSAKASMLAGYLNAGTKIVSGFGDVRKAGGR